jgi:hypothetical protein
MYRLSDQQTDFILDDIRAHGIKTESLQQNLLDHICIIIEQGLEENGNFEQFYPAVMRTFYKQELRELEEEAFFLLEHKGPHILLSRNQFFLILFTLFIGPFVAYALFSGPAGGSGISGIPVEVWRGTLVLSLFPLLVLLVILLTPERFDPLIPRRSVVLLGIRPFIRIIPPDAVYAQ